MRWFLLSAVWTVLCPSLLADTIVSVPGNANPWLAGMPAGSAAGSDRAPEHSPVLVPGIDFDRSMRLQFTVSGAVANDESFDLSGRVPDGVDSSGRGWWPQHNAGEQNGLSNIFRSPGNALIGVFLSDDRPDLSPAPATLDFREGGNVLGGINYDRFSPDLKQVFFIGDGRTASGAIQQIAVPADATRLFLGTMDSTGWYNNIGQFEVSIHVVPEPSGQLLLLIGLGVLIAGVVTRPKTLRQKRQVTL